MATIKSYTDIEQSKVLSEILPIESADMTLPFMHHNNEYLPKYPVSRNYIEVYNEMMKLPLMEGEDIDQQIQPCWSIAALLGVLPQSITKYIESEKCQKTFHLNLFRSHYYCCSYSFRPSISDNDGSNNLYCIGRDNWLDACYEMILKLHELKML